MGSFWHLRPHDLYIIARGKEIALKEQIELHNFTAYLQGAYIVEALLATVGNMFSDKHSTKHKYPDEPYDLNLDGDKKGREQERQLEMFKANLDTAMSNFNLAKKQG